VILVRLAGAFDLTLAGCCCGRRPGTADPGHRTPVWRDPDTGYLRKQVSAGPTIPRIIRVELPAGQRVVLPASSYAHIRQAVWVQAGQLVIIEAGRAA